jgi:hypothetical protein
LHRIIKYDKLIDFVELILVIDKFIVATMSKEELEQECKDTLIQLF